MVLRANRELPGDRIHALPRQCAGPQRSRESRAHPCEPAVRVPAERPAEEAQPTHYSLPTKPVHTKGLTLTENIKVRPLAGQL